MRDSCDQILKALQPARLSALEISGTYFGKYGFRTYRSACYPDYDLCAGPLSETFDLVIAEQVFEHLLWPYRAGRHVHAMLADGGHFLISTPFLIKIHDDPIDCSRWSEIGLKHFLAECGFPLERIRTWSWGNRAVVQANFTEFGIPFRRRIHTLDNNPEFPYHVWAIAQKA
jgi:SAM-dependent methyltransferase